MLELFSKGYRNFEMVYFPNEDSLPSWALILGSGTPITSNEFFIAWEEVYKVSIFYFSSFEI
jgi:hypothetical protein